MGRVPYYPDVNTYRTHYGGNLSVFRAYKPSSQHGSGFFGSLIKSFVPLVKSGTKSLLKTGLKTGANVLSDVLSGDANIKTALRDRGKEALSDIANSVVNTVSSSNNRKNHEPKKRQVASRKRKSVSTEPQKKRRKRKNTKPDIFG